MENKELLFNTIRELPSEIEQYVGSESYELNSVGMSGSEVRIYDRYVLKIQPQSPETDNEAAIVRWLGEKLPVPAIPAYCVKDGIAYTLMQKAKGNMLCARDYFNNPELIIKLVAEGLRILWSVDISNCPCSYSRLSERLKHAEYNVEHGHVDTENVAPDTYGPNGFADPKELLAWLKEHRPEEDLVLTHGDFCLPNLLAEGDQIQSFIDLGRMGPADRWQDIAISIRSISDNLSGKYSGGKKYYDFKPEMLLKELGIPFDEEKFRYYKLLDELY